VAEDYVKYEKDVCCGKWLQSVPLDEQLEKRKDYRPL
jgi:hypothetical protein